MARYVSTLVQCDKCYKTIEIDFFSEELVDRELEEKGWNVETGDDICPDCWEEMNEEEGVEETNE